LFDAIIMLLLQNRTNIFGNAGQLWINVGMLMIAFQLLKLLNKQQNFLK